MCDSVRRAVWGVSGLLLLTLAGCGPRMTAVEGRIVYRDGTPATDLSGGFVIFEPVDNEHKLSSRAQILEDGTFRVGTYKDTDGTVEGRHRVLIQPPWPERVREDRPPPRPPIHSRYRSFDTSGLEFDVSRDNCSFTITVDRP